MFSRVLPPPHNMGGRDRPPHIVRAPCATSDSRNTEPTALPTGSLARHARGPLTRSACHAGSALRARDEARETGTESIVGRSLRGAGRALRALPVRRPRRDRADRCPRNVHLIRCLVDSNFEAKRTLPGPQAPLRGSEPHASSVCVQVARASAWEPRGAGTPVSPAAAWEPERVPHFKTVYSSRRGTSVPVCVTLWDWVVATLIKSLDSLKKTFIT